MALEDTNSSTETLPVSERERLLGLSLVQAAELGPEMLRPTFLDSIDALRRRPVSSPKEGDKLHPTLYKWLWDNCRLTGIETIGDIVRVMKAVPPENRTGQKPWIWMVEQASTSQMPKFVLELYDILKKKGFFLPDIKEKDAAGV